MERQQNSTPLLERNQNLGTAEVKSVSAQNQKKAVKAREESSIKAMQQMHTSMAVSKNFLSSFPSATQSLAHMQVRKMSSEITAPLVVTGLQTPTARPDNIQQGNAITQLQLIPGQRKDWSYKPPNCHRFADTNGATQQHPARKNHCSTPKPIPAQREVWGRYIYHRATNTKRQENAICQRPRQYQARGRSPERGRN